MDTSRTPTSAADDQKTRMTSNHPHANQYAYQENAYHQKPPSFNHKVNISLVDDVQAKASEKAPKSKNEKQQQAEWRESIPIKLEHLLFNFKENSMKVYKQSPPRIMQIFALIAALLLFCGVLALVLSQRDDHLKKEANLPLDQSAVAERIVGESLLSSHKLKNALFEQKNQTSPDKARKFSKSASDASKDAAVRKAFGSLLQFSGDDNDEVEPDQEENSSDESFDGERSRNFNLFLSDERPDDKEQMKPNTNEPQSDNPKVMFIERLMGLHFGLQPKIGVSESLVIRKTIGGDDNAIAGDDQTSAKSDSEVDLLFNGKRAPNSNKIKEARNQEDPTPFLLRYAAAAMLSRVLATAQQQAYIQQLQQQQQRYREMNEKYNTPYRGYRMMREPESAASYMYGRPIHLGGAHHKHPTRPAIASLPFQPAASQFIASDRGFSRGPLISNEEAESQQMHPIILMLNIPYRDQTPAAQLMGAGPQSQSFAHPAIESSIQPIFMPRQNPYYKTQPQAQRDQSIYSSPFAHNKNYYQPPPPPPQHPVANSEGYYAAHHHHHPYSSMMQQQPPMNRAAAPPTQRYNHRTITNTIEVPIEIHHQVSPSPASAVMNHQAPTAQIIVQPQIETQSQPNDASDQSGENEHHMVVFYSDSDNVNHSEENAPNQASAQAADQQPPSQPSMFVKENKHINNDLEKTGKEISKMLLLHFVNPQQQQAQQAPQTQSPVDINTTEQQRKSPQSVRPFLINQQEQPEKQMMPPKNKPIILNNQNKPQQQPNKPELMIKSEEEASSSNDQMNREEFEKDAANNDGESETTSLAHFAQVIRHQLHVIDQQQNQAEPQQRQPTIQPVTSISPSAVPQQSATPIQAQLPQQVLPPNRQQDIQMENSNKEIENKAQESAAAPAFMLVQDNDEN